MKKRRTKRLKLRDELDRVFSIFIRQRDGGRCVTCGASGNWQDFQCGHWIKRQYNGTRFDERNCNSQCGTCNGVRRGAVFEHAAYIAGKYGAPVLEELLMLKRAGKKWISADLLDKIETYKVGIDKLGRRTRQ